MPVLYDSAVVIDNFILSTLKFYYITCNQLPLQTFIRIRTFTMYQCIIQYGICISIIHVCICMVLQLFLLEEVRERKYDGFARKIQKAWRRYKSDQYFFKLKQKGKSFSSVYMCSM